MFRPTLESDLQLLYRLGRGSIPLHMGIADASLNPVLFNSFYGLDYPLQLVELSFAYVGPGPLVADVTLDAELDGTPIGTVVVGAATISGSVGGFLDEPVEVMAESLLTIGVTGDVANSGDIAVTAILRPI